MLTEIVTDRTQAFWDDFCQGTDADFRSYGIIFRVQIQIWASSGLFFECRYRYIPIFHVFRLIVFRKVFATFRVARITSQSRKLRLVGWSMSRPTVPRVALDLPECKGFC